MKYYEAIDMILDGGIAYMKSRSPVLQLRFTFIDERLKYRDNDSDRWSDATLTAYIIGKEDWIVEKDGVVYDKLEYTLECPSCGDPNNITHRCEKCRDLYLATRIYRAQDPAKTLYEACKNAPWPDEPQSVAIAIDEDWLEKKMGCFLGRHVRTNPMNNLAMHYCEQKDCGTAACPFCFPEEKPAERKCNECNSTILDGHPRYALESIPSYCYCLKCWNEMVDEEIDRPSVVANANHEYPSFKQEDCCSVCGNSEKLKTCKYTIDGIIFCQDCKKADPKIDAQYPEPPEKVTVNDLENIIYSLYRAKNNWEKHCIEHECNIFLLGDNMISSANLECDIKSNLYKKLSCTDEELTKKLIYLVSLQEK